MPAGKLLRVTFGRVREARDWALTKEEAEHAPDVTAAHCMPSLPRRIQDTVDKLPGNAVKICVGVTCLELLKGLDARCHGQGVAAERAGLVHGSSRRHHLHDVSASTIGAHRQASTDDLAHGGHVGSHTKVLLCTAVGHTEARHHLVKDKESAVLCCQLAKADQELLRGRDEAGVAHDRFKDHGRNLIVLEQRLNRIEVVVLRTDSGTGGALGHTWRIGQTKRCHTRACLHEEGIGMAVVAPLKLDDRVALGVGPHQPDHAHASLGAAVGEAHHLDRGHGVDDHLGQLVLQYRRCAEGGALLQLLRQCLQHVVICVPYDGRAPSANVVDVLVAIDVPSVCPFHTVEDNWAAPDGLEGTHWA
mmetsp:Transcript_15205/g.35590  ORF Transcript_15205/g.35590 Transcript_15205/m.35590 type:complete len:361 (-) Transcript_15205:349-1431(-)